MVNKAETRVQFGILSNLLKFSLMFWSKLFVVIMTYSFLCQNVMLRMAFIIKLPVSIMLSEMELLKESISTSSMWLELLSFNVAFLIVSRMIVFFMLFT